MLDASATYLVNAPGNQLPVRARAARWIASADRKKLDAFIQSKYSSTASDLDGDPVFLARSAFDLDYTRERTPDISFTDIKDVKERAA